MMTAARLAFGMYAQYGMKTLRASRTRVPEYNPPAWVLTPLEKLTADLEIDPEVGMDCTKEPRVVLKLAVKTVTNKNCTPGK